MSSIPAPAESIIPARPTAESLRAAASACRACPLFAQATQTVFGEGPAPAKLMLVGETPGDQEDRDGRPFVGPAGRLLDRCLAEAGIERKQAYVTNAVKHFKWVPRGKRRLHAKPSSLEIRACHPWVMAEIRLVRPFVLLCLGATAAQSLIGPGIRVTRHRGQRLDSPLAPIVMATVHPSALLRAQPDQRQIEIDRFIRDLRHAAAAIRERQD